MAQGRWQTFVQDVEQRQGTLFDTRQQHWCIMQRCALDLAACEDLSVHDALRTRAHLYRSYQALAQGYVAIRQAEGLEGRLAAVVDALKASGHLPGDFTL